MTCPLSPKVFKSVRGSASDTVRECGFQRALTLNPGVRRPAGPRNRPQPDPANPNTFPLLGVRLHGNLFFSARMIAFSLLGSALAITG